MSGLQIWLPDGARPTLFCSVPVRDEKGEVKACGQAFTEREVGAFTRHVLECTKRHEGTIHEEKPSEKRGIFHGVWDKELEAFIERNREGIVEGRVRLSDGPARHRRPRLPR